VTLGVSFSLFGVSALIEGAITLAVFQSVESLNPKFVRQPKADRGLALALVALTAVMLAGAGVLVASPDPDGLESLAGTLGIAGRAQALVAAPLADYQAGFLESEWTRKAGAGITGLILIYGACALMGRVVRRRDA
jgi:hypothetical protein